MAIEYKSVEFPCDHIAPGTDGEPIPWCDTNTHPDDEILARWRASPNGTVNGTANYSVDDWKLALSEYVKILAGAERHYEWTRADFRAYVLDDVKGLPERRQERFLHPPKSLSASEIEEEIQNVIDFYLPAKPKDLDYEAGNGAKPKTPSRGLMRASEYLVQYAERAARPFVWEETLYRGAFNMFLGRPFTGKSSVAAALTRSVVLTLPFIGRRCNPARSGYLALERNGAAVAKMFEKWGIAEKVFFADEIPAKDAPEFIDREIKRLNLEFLIIDHLQHAARIQQGNEYAEVSNALLPYQTIAKVTGCCILALHHQGKAQQEEGADDTIIEALGSEAYRAASDTLIEATAVRGQFFLRAHPRAGSYLDRTHVEIDFDTGEVTGTDTHLADLAASVEKIRDFLFRKGRPQTEKDIRTAIGGRTKTTSEAVREALKRGQVVRSGAGGRADPYLYSLVPDEAVSVDVPEDDRF